MLKIVCAWCGKTIKEGVKDAPVSHLICTPCYERGKRHTKHLYPDRIKPGMILACRAKRFETSC